MATCWDLSPRTIPQDEHSLRCSVCLDDFKDPKVLPCCHTFCKSCLEKIKSTDSTRELGPEVDKLPRLSSQTATGDQVEQSGEEMDCHRKCRILVICPQCRAEHRITGGVDALLTDFAIESEQQSKAVASSMEQRDKRLCCGLCDSTHSVVSYCDDCSSPLCNFCHEAHCRQRQYKVHAVKSIDEIDSSIVNTSTSRKHITHLVCSEHPTQVSQIFCDSCLELVCCDCVIEGHEGHTFVGINSQTRHEMEKKLTDTSSKVYGVLKSFEENRQYVRSVEKVTSDEEIQAKADINKMFESYITALQVRRDSLLAKAEEHYSAKLKFLWSEKDHLEKMIAQLNSTLRFSERSQKCVNDGEFLLLASQALFCLKTYKKSLWDSKRVEDQNWHYLRVEKRLGEPEVFESAARLDELKTILSPKVEWKEFPAHIDLGKKIQAVISVKRYGKRDQPFVLSMKPLVSICHRDSPTCNVAEISIVRSTALPGDWDVTFVPYCSGPHTCSVTVNRTKKKASTVKSFDVAAVPPVGSRVMRGPSWNYDEATHSYGANAADVGVVADHASLVAEKRITVRWSDGKLFCYRWGLNSIFDVQLHH